MLSYALGTIKSVTGGGSISEALHVSQAASYLNDKVHDLASTLLLCMTKPLPRFVSLICQFRTTRYLWKMIESFKMWQVW